VLQHTGSFAYLHALISDSFEVSESLFGRFVRFRGRHPVSSVFLLEHFDVKAQLIFDVERDFPGVELLE
jgi:hypothetical protein